MLTRIGMVLTVCIFFTFCNNGGDSGNNTNPGDTTHIPNDTTHVPNDTNHQPVDTGRLMNSTYSTTIYNFHDTSFVDSTITSEDSVFKYKFCNLGFNCRDSAFLYTPAEWSRIRKIGDRYVLGGDTLTLKSENGSSFLELLNQDSAIYKIPVEVQGTQFTLTLSGYLLNHHKIYSMGSSILSMDSLKYILKHNCMATECFDSDPKTVCYFTSGWDTAKAAYYFTRIVYGE